MSTTHNLVATSYVRGLIESRPPGVTWSRPSPPQQISAVHSELSCSCRLRPGMCRAD